MTWKLWLDDQLDDPDAPTRHTPAGSVGAKSSAEAIKLVEERGEPFFMDLDHDLGGDDNAMVFLRWLQRKFPETVPEYVVHSRNVVGEPAIHAFMRSWEKSIGLPHIAINDAEVLSALHGVEISSVFMIDKDEAAKISAFTAEHHKLHKGKDGAIGGRFTYCFTPTTLFIKVSCKCACGAECDATDYADI